MQPASQLRFDKPAPYSNFREPKIGLSIEMGGFAMNSFKKIAPLGLLFVAAVVFAKTWGPFYIDKYFPGWNYSRDVDEDYRAAAQTPVLVMNTSVTKIKKGHTIRVVYANGEIYDYEVLQNYSQQNSHNLIGNPVKTSSQAAATPTVSATYAAWMRQCQIYGNGAGSFGVSTGYWSETTEIVDGAVKVTATWTDTGMNYLPMSSMPRCV